MRVIVTYSDIDAFLASSEECIAVVQDLDPDPDNDGDENGTPFCRVYADDEVAAVVENELGWKSPEASECLDCLVVYGLGSSEVVDALRKIYPDLEEERW